jgi:hypothetical protein
MKRSICTDAVGCEQLTELLCFRIDPRIAAQNTSAVRIPAPANWSTPTSANARAAGPQPCVTSAIVPNRGRQNFVPRQMFVPRNVQSVECLVHVRPAGTHLLAIRLRYESFKSVLCRSTLYLTWLLICRVNPYSYPSEYSSTTYQRTCGHNFAEYSNIRM